MNTIFSLAGGAAAVVIALLLNLGYVYKTSCPSGTSWHYSALDDVIPYTRQAAAPCHTHSATRLALSAIGIAKVKETSGTGASATADKANQQAADTLREATAVITAEYARQRSLVAQFQNGNLTMAERRARFAKGIEGTITGFRETKNRLDVRCPARQTRTSSRHVACSRGGLPCKRGCSECCYMRLHLNGRQRRMRSCGHLCRS